MEKLLDLRTALDALAERIGLSGDALCGAERVDAIRFYDGEYPADKLGNLAADAVSSVSKLCGDAFRFVVKIDEVTLLSLTGETNEDDFLQLQKDLRSQQTVTLELTVEKTQLPSLWDIDVSVPIVHLFLFASRCADVIAGTIHEPADFERLLWNDGGEGRCVVVVGDTDVRVEGPYLSVVGARQFDDWATRQNDEAMPVAELHRIHNACRDMVRWEQPWSRHLVPAALMVKTDDPGSSIVQGIFAHWVNLCMLFLADRVREDENRHLAIFVTERRRAQAALLEQLDLEEPLDVSQVEAMGKIAAFAYEEHWIGDRLRMAQALIAQTLAPQPQPVSARQLLANAPTIWHDLQWQWKSFMAKEIERYTTEERELENEVGETVAGFDTEVADMIKSLTAAMLGAVGALIGSLIAGAFKEPFNPLIFSTGVIAFLAYLILFPGLYGMTHHLIRFHTLKRLFARRRQRYERIIDRERVADIVGNTISRGTCRFYCWFTATLAALAVVAILCVVAVHKVPEWVEQSTAAKPAVTRNLPGHFATLLAATSFGSYHARMRNSTWL